MQRCATRKRKRKRNKEDADRIYKVQEEVELDVDEINSDNAWRTSELDNELQTSTPCGGDLELSKGLEKAEDDLKLTPEELCHQLESKCNERKDKPMMEPECPEGYVDVITLAAEHSESEKKLKEDNDKLKEELRVVCLQLERLQADLRLSEELNKADMELMCKEVELQHTTQMNAQLEQFNKELKSASIGRVEAETVVNFLMKENAELRRKFEEVERQLVHLQFDGHKEAVPEKSVARSSGIHVKMLPATYFQCWLCSIRYCMLLPCDAMQNTFMR